MEPARATVAYLLSTAPQSRSTFTHDELAHVAGHVGLIPAGVAWDGSADPDGWLTGGPIWSLQPFAALARQLRRHGRPLIRLLVLLTIWSVPSPRALAVAWRAALSACVLAERATPQLIHAQFAGPAAVAAFVWAQLADIPWTVRAHAYDIYRPYRWAPHVLRRATRVIAISEHARRHLRDEMSVPSRLVRVGIPTTGVAARGSMSRGASLRLVSVGSLHEKKGHDLAIRAAHALARGGIEVSLDIIGEGPLRRSLERLAVGPARVSLPGHRHVSDVRSAYHMYDAFIMTPVKTRSGDMDGIPVAMMEAMAARLPVFATLTGGMGELLQDAATGTVLRGTPERMAETIERAIQDPDRLDRLTSAAAQRIQQEFDVEATSQHLATEWLDAIHEFSAARAHEP